MRRPSAAAYALTVRLLRPMRPLPLLFFVSSSLTGTTAAQIRQADIVKPAACADGLEALGLTSAPRRVEIRVRYDSVTDSSLAVYARPNAAVIMRPSYGVNMITGIMHSEKRPPTPLPPLELDLLVHSLVPRPPDERSLSFQLDDSANLALGLAGAHAGVQVGGLGVNEHIIAMISPSDALRLLHARKIRGSLGSTKFAVSDQDRDGLRALVMYVRCGAP
jgi:hypothetical protein